MTNGEKLKTLFPTIRLSYDILGQRRIFDRNMLIADDEWWNAEYKEIEEKQEPKEGHWIVHPKGVYAHLVCDKCLSNAPYDCKTNYCPNCGAKMESEDKYVKDKL
jgi:hypothetical protein